VNFWLVYNWQLAYESYETVRASAAVVFQNNATVICFTYTVRLINGVRLALHEERYEFIETGNLSRNL